MPDPTDSPYLSPPGSPAALRVTALSQALVLHRESVPDATAVVATATTFAAFLRGE